MRVAYLKVFWASLSTWLISLCMTYMPQWELENVSVDELEYSEWLLLVT